MIAMSELKKDMNRPMKYIYSVYIWLHQQWRSDKQYENINILTMIKINPLSLIL